MDERTIFTTALEQPDTRARASYLDAACSADPALRSRIEDLLALHEQSGGFLERSPLAPGRTQRIDRSSADLFDDQHDPRTIVEAESAGEIDLGFLAPSDDPGALGSIGQYTVTSVIGRGGMGIVLKARDASLNRVVAIKVLAPELAGNTTARKRFLREARAAAAIVHQHVVTIHAVAEDLPPYLVMEYVNGQSLQDKLNATGPLELKETLRIGAQVAAGLAAAHSQGVVHRDITPSNILLENGVERVRITDFGLARAADDVEITHPGEVAGTPQYMSPEQALGQSVDARSDLFSLGSVLYAMCTGRAPFRAESTIAAIRRVCDDTPRPIQEVNTETPPWLTRIIDRLLAKRPEERFQSAYEVSDLLGQHLAHVQAPAVHPQSASLPMSLSGKGTRVRDRARQPWVTAALVLLAVLIGLGVTEATGVTQLASTMVRIVTGEGTLVIEVDDPTVQVSLDGEELTISGGGVQEVRLRPGQHQFTATRNGAQVKQELVTITRGDERVVTVSREAISPANAVSETFAEPGAFVVLGGTAEVERKFDTLADAVLGASDGDTIEIRGNGPWLVRPISLGTQNLHIRAANGFQPVIRLRRESGEKDLPLFQSESVLSLEGLEFQSERPPKTILEGAYIGPVQSLYAANCKFLPTSFICNWCLEWSTNCHFKNCEFYQCTAVAGFGPPNAEWILENCIQAGHILSSFNPYPSGMANRSITINHCTLASGGIAVNLADLPLPHEESRPESRSLHVQVSDSVIANAILLWVNQTEQSVAGGATVTPANPDAYLQSLIEWRSHQSLFHITAGPWIEFNPRRDADAPPAPSDLAAWRKYWNSDETNNLEGPVQFRRNDLAGRMRMTRDTVTPDDFRLREDSPGYRAGPDGKDLGADIDLVGPGTAYERWKQTPEYQEWRKETGQVK